MRKTHSLFALVVLVPVMAGSLWAAGSGPETADQVRARRAKMQLEANRRKQDRDAKAQELGEMPEIDPVLVEEYTEMLDVIADPSMEGRVPGSRGIEDAAEYIEENLRGLGLVPAFSETVVAADGTEVISPNASYRQVMQMGSQSSATTERLVVGDRAFEAGGDYSPLAYSGSGLVHAPVEFVGYAIVSGPNNYLGFETDETIEGKIALCLNYEPMDEEGNSLWRDGKWSHNARLTYKVTALERRGAAAVVIVSPPGANDEKVGLLETIASTSPAATKMGKQTGPEYDIPVIHVTPEVAKAILAYTQGGAMGALELEDLIAMANTSGVVMAMGDREISLEVQMERTPKWTSNIGAILPGRGDLKDEYVVIGSHYDHVGYGKFGSRAPSRRGEIHPGADDNGSGTTANLIAAETLTQRYALLGEDADARSILFLWFTAEESGLNGSRFYVDHPITDLDKHVVMLNMDMVGTLSDGLLEVGGMRSAPGLKEFAEPHLKSAAIPYSTQVSVGDGRSDHASFNAVGIPNLFFFTGLHERYHTPDDTTEFVDDEGGVRVSLLVSGMAYDAATRSEGFAKPKKEAKKSKKDGPNVRVGIIPSNNGDGGMNVERVFEDTSASAAGLRVGDVIVAWGGETIDSVEEWMPILTANEPGDVVVVEVLRDGEKMELEMTLRGIE
ncbi:MAG: M28 family peptidase [Phycisphaerales bacterium]